MKEEKDRFSKGSCYIWTDLNNEILMLPRELVQH